VVSWNKEAFMPVKKLTEYLDSNQIKYVSLTHSPAFTAQEIAASVHVPGKELAKSVIVKLDGKMAMAVLPASYKIDFDLLREAAGAKKVELASENEFREKFPECDVGSMPPFGNLYGMDVYVAESLAEDENIAFSAGSHVEVVKISYEDFENLVRPKVVKFSQKD
jgi:Ala-tRNA(Pro) deacylase